MGASVMSRRQTSRMRREAALPWSGRTRSSARVRSLMAGHHKGSAISRWIEQSGMKASLSGVLIVSLVLAAIMAIVAAMVTHTRLSMPIGAAVGFSVPFLVLRSKRTRRLRTFEEAFPEALDLIRARAAGTRSPRD